MEVARLVRAASVIDVTAESVEEALESGAAQQDPAWGLGFRNLGLQVQIERGLVRVRGPVVLMDHLRRLGFKTPPLPPAKNLTAGGRLLDTDSRAREVVLEMEAISRMMEADLAEVLRNPSPAFDAVDNSTRPVLGTEAPAVGSDGSRAGHDKDDRCQQGISTSTTSAASNTTIGSYQHVTPKSVVAFIERSVETLFTREQVPPGRRYGARGERGGGKRLDMRGRCMISGGQEQTHQ